MGNIFSGIFKKDTPIDPNDTLNYLLKGIFTNIDMMDMFALMNQEKCSEYIIFGEKVVDKFFEKAQISPSSDEKGYIYFKKMSSLSREILRSNEYKKQCREISRFFADILRCFAAIYLSIVIPSKEINTLMGADGPFTTRLFPPKQKGGTLDTNWFIIEGNSDIDHFGSLFFKDFKLNDREDYISLNLNTTNSYIKVLCSNINGKDNTEKDTTLDDFIKSTVSSKKFKFNYTKPIPMEYVVNNKSVLSFSFEIIKLDNTSQFKISNFKFENNSPIEGNINYNFVCTIDQNDVIDTEMNKPVNQSFFLIFNELLKNSVTANYLKDWHYITEPVNNEKYQEMKNTGNIKLFFDEKTRDQPEARIIYIKDSVTGSEESETKEESQTETIDVSCKILITETGPPTNMGNLIYNISISEITAKRMSNKSKSTGNLLTPLSSPQHYKMIGKKGEAPIFVKRSGTKYNFHTFIAWIIERQFTQNEIGSTYEKVKGTAGFLKVPPIEPNDPYDLSNLQKMLLPNKNPFPACKALAKELYQDLGNNKYSTAVCSTKFRKELNASLPTNKDITSSKGILALSSLFLDTTHNSAEGLTKNPEWNQFESEMKRLSLNKNCNTNGTFYMNQSLANNVHEIVKQLEARHESHLSFAFDLLWELFDKNSAQNKRTFMLNENLYLNGGDYLKNIKIKCIQLLTNYYLDCDKIYLSGFELIMTREKELKPIEE